MFQRLPHRGLHYLLLITVGSILYLPHLGAPSLWDIDEGNNAEAAREMMLAGNWVVPTFNYGLRSDKPALLYWLQIAAYRLWGVNEFSARFPSALASLLAVLGTYELGRRLFHATTGLLAGLILASAAFFCAAAHFANPDALLNACTVLTLAFFWHSYSRGGRSWFVPAGLCAGLGVLAKGPVGILLPAAAIGLFLFWSRRLSLLLDRRIFWGTLALLLVALPWYAWVGVETKMEFLRGFFWTHHVDRFRAPMEHHSGPVFYYLAILAVGLAPWSSFLGPTVWYAWRDLASRQKSIPLPTTNTTPQVRFLVCWIGVYFIFFSLAGTKLPNYILPLYAPLALLLARFLDRWRCGDIQPPKWVMGVSLVCFGLMGVAVAVSLGVVGGAIPVPAWRGQRLPGVEKWAGAGLVLVIAALVAGWLFQRERLWQLLTVLIASSVSFVVILTTGIKSVDAYKAPRTLVQALAVQQTESDIRIGCYDYFQPSLVFYCRRQVHRLNNEREALEHLRCALECYLFIPASTWERLKDKTYSPCRLVARHHDAYRRCEVCLVTNR